MGDRQLSPSSPEVPADLVSVDVEDYYHLYIDRPESWDRYEVRIREGADRAIALLERLGIRATCFILGDAARRAPEAVRALAAAGHEIATHGDSHQLVYRLGREGCREDIRRSLGILGDLAGRPVEGYRASSFSITPDTLWVWDLLQEEGIRYSSSLHPVANFLYGRAVRTPLHPHVVRETGVVEIPVVPARVAGRAVPFSGGFYLRFWPRPVLERLAAGLRRQGAQVQWYFHTWEVDPRQPRLPLAPHWRFFRYHRLTAMEPVLETLLAGRRTELLRDVAARVREGWDASRREVQDAVER